MSAGTLGRLARLEPLLASPCPGCAGWPPVGFVDDEARCPEVPERCPPCGKPAGIRCVVVPAPRLPDPRAAGQAAGRGVDPAMDRSTRARPRATTAVGGPGAGGVGEGVG